MRIPFTLVLVPLAVWQASAAGFGEGYADLVEKISSAVVYIQTSQTSGESPGLFGGGTNREIPRGSGSGFLVSEDGYVITNRHVVADSQSITILLLDGKRLSAKVVGTDNSLDIALLKIEGRGFNHLRIGSSEAMRIGDPVLAIGYPLNLGFSVTSGIISGFGRDMATGGMDLALYIQTDADISYGNSGGPLVNNKGEVIGINTLVQMQGGSFGFAIPSDIFRSSIDQLKKYGRVRRGALGVEVGNLPDKVRETFNLEYGAWVNSVTSGFPAQRAGLRPNDVILEVDGVKVRGGTEVVSLIAAKPPGAKVILKILSAGRESTKQVTLGDRNHLVGDPESEPPGEEPGPENLRLDPSVPPSGKGRGTDGPRSHSDQQSIRRFAYHPAAPGSGAPNGPLLSADWPQSELEPVAHADLLKKAPLF